MQAGSSERTPDRKPTSWTARIVAPLALAGAVAAIVLIVGGSVGSSDDDGDGGENGRGRNATTTTSGCQPAADKAVEDGFFVIEEGEDLSVVAAKTCMTPDRLERLNPNLDPQLIPVGACVDLRKDGCKALASQG